MILVSGAGSGIGRAIAQSLAEAKYGIVLLGRSRQSLNETLSMLDTSTTHAVISADIRDANALRDGLKDLKPVLGGVVANAGLGGENHYGDEESCLEFRLR